MKTKKTKQDTRPRFGWTEGLDSDPQTIYEFQIAGGIPVVVIPLPYVSGALRKKIRDFAKETIWPKD